MTTLSYHPTPPHQHQQGKTKLRVLLFWGGLLWVSVLFFLFLPRLWGGIITPITGWPAGMDIPVALAAASLLGLIAGATLVAQLRGYTVPAWVPLIPALLLFVLLWWM